MTRTTQRNHTLRKAHARRTVTRRAAVQKATQR